MAQSFLRRWEVGRVALRAVLSCEVWGSLAIKFDHPTIKHLLFKYNTTPARLTSYPASCGRYNAGKYQQHKTCFKHASWWQTNLCLIYFTTFSYGNILLNSQHWKNVRVSWSCKVSLLNNKNCWNIHKLRKNRFDRKLFIFSHAILFIIWFYIFSQLLG